MALCNTYTKDTDQTQTQTTNEHSPSLSLQRRHLPCTDHLNGFIRFIRFTSGNFFWRSPPADAFSLLQSTLRCVQSAWHQWWLAKTVLLSLGRCSCCSNSMDRGLRAVRKVSVFLVGFYGRCRNSTLISITTFGSEDEGKAATPRRSFCHFYTLHLRRLLCWRFCNKRHLEHNDNWIMWLPTKPLLLPPAAFAASAAKASPPPKTPAAAAATATKSIDPKFAVELTLPHPSAASEEEKKFQPYHII